MAAPWRLAQREGLVEGRDVDDLAWLPTYKQSTAGSGWAGWSAAPPESPPELPPESSADASAKYNSNSVSWV